MTDTARCKAKLRQGTSRFTCRNPALTVDGYCFVHESVGLRERLAKLLAAVDAHRAARDAENDYTRVDGALYAVADTVRGG